MLTGFSITLDNKIYNFRDRLQVDTDVLTKDFEDRNGLPVDLPGAAPLAPSQVRFRADVEMVDSNFQGTIAAEWEGFVQGTVLVETV